MPPPVIDEAIDPLDKAFGTVAALTSERLATLARSSFRVRSAAATLERLVRHESTILRWASRTKPSFVLGLYENRTVRLRLDRP